MSPIANIYEELKNNNQALEAVDELLGATNQRAPVNQENLSFLIRIIIERNNRFIEQLVA